MQPGESTALETPIPRIVFLVGWGLYLPFLILSVQWGAPAMAYPAIAGVGLLAGAVLFLALITKKFVLELRALDVPPAPPEEASPPSTPRNTGRIVLPAPMSPVMKRLTDPKQQPQYKQIKGKFRRMAPRAATLKQRDLQRRWNAGPTPRSSVSGRETSSRRSVGSFVDIATVHSPSHLSAVTPDTHGESLPEVSRELPALPPAATPQVPLTDEQRKQNRLWIAVRFLNMVVTEGPVFVGLVAVVVLSASVPGVGAYMLQQTRATMPVKAGFWLAAAAVFVCELLFAGSYAYLREAGLRVTEDKFARSSRKRLSREADFNFRGRRQRCRNVSRSLRRCFRCCRSLFAGRLVAIEAARLIVQGAVLGIGLFVGYCAVAAFVVGALAGSVLLAIFWAAESRTPGSVLVAIVSSLVLLCLCPLTWYCYCSKTARKAAQFTGGGSVRHDYEWRDRIQNAFFRKPQRVVDASALAKLAALTQPEGLEIVPMESGSGLQSGKPYEIRRDNWGRIVMAGQESKAGVTAIRNPLDAEFV